jgi:hypothetical protein
MAHLSEGPPESDTRAPIIYRVSARQESTRSDAVIAIITRIAEMVITASMFGVWNRWNDKLQNRAAITGHADEGKR